MEAESDGIVENEMHGNKRREKVTKTMMHTHMLSDPWKIGQNLFAKKDVLKLRSEGVLRRARKSRLRGAILNAIREQTGEDNEVIVGIELPELSIWQRFTRGVANNLSLNYST